MFVALLLGATPVRGQVARGVVLSDESSGTVRIPVEGAQVDLIGPTGDEVDTTTTDSLGVFVFAGLAPGIFGLRVSHVAYRPVETAPFEVGATEAVALEVRLGREAIPLEPLVVTARVSSTLADFHRRRGGAGHGTYLTRSDIETRGAGYTTDLLRGMPGIRLDFVRWGTGPRVEMQSGFGPCEPGIFVDGAEMAGSAAGSLNDFLTPDRIEGVEVYSSLSTVPAQFRVENCGAILFWTRRGDRGEGKPWSWWRLLVGVGSAVGLVLWLG